MPEYTTVRPVRPLRLVEELQAGLVGLDPFHTVQVASNPDSSTTIYYPNIVTEAAVAAIVATHDATLLSQAEQRTAADVDALAAFRLGWLLGQARLQGSGVGSIQTQMDTIQALTNAQVLTGANVKILSEAVEDIAREVFKLKRTVAIQADVSDR
jgi:hypothetical protein